METTLTNSPSQGTTPSPTTSGKTQQKQDDSTSASSSKASAYTPATKFASNDVSAETREEVAQIVTICLDIAERSRQTGKDVVMINGANKVMRLEDGNNRFYEVKITPQTITVYNEDGLELLEKGRVQLTENQIKEIDRLISTLVEDKIVRARKMFRAFLAAKTAQHGKEIIY